MPPKVRFSREVILQAALELTRKSGIEALNVADYFIETPVGEGDVNWNEYFKALREIGFDGYLTIERETGADPISDIKKAYAFAKDCGVLN